MHVRLVLGTSLVTPVTILFAMHVCLVLATSLVTLPVTIHFACVFRGVGLPTLVSGVLQQLQIADRPEVRGVESATCNYMLPSTLYYCIYFHVEIEHLIAG